MFSWDIRKAQIIYENHGVAFEQAATVVADPDGLNWEDLAHSREERHHKHLGRSVTGRFLLSVYTASRTPHGKEVIRIISARQASRKAGKAYAG